jgi:hypothetical protein
LGLLLFVAELGSGFGHVRRLLPIARAAVAAGHRALFLVDNPDEVKSFVQGAGVELGQTPCLRPPAARVPGALGVATSFADILGTAGFTDAAFLASRASLWDATLEALRPAAIVCESSPFLNLACFGSELPVLSVGHGFGLPPPHLPSFPKLWNGAALCSEAQLLDTVTKVCDSRRRPKPGALPALLAGSIHAVTGFDVLDPYRNQRQQRSVGPPALDLDGAAGEPHEDVFAYLLGDAPATQKLLEGLVASGLTGRVFVRRGSVLQRRTLAGSGITWLERPEPIRDALARAQLSVHHGSMLSTEESLVAGRPALVVPLYLEHLITARALVSLGAAQVIRPAQGTPEIAQSLLAARNDAVTARAARAFAETYWRRARSPDVPAMLLGALLSSGAVARGALSPAAPPG